MQAPQASSGHCLGSRWLVRAWLEFELRPFDVTCVPYITRVACADWQHGLCTSPSLSRCPVSVFMVHCCVHERADAPLAAPHAPRALGLSDEVWRTIYAHVDSHALRTVCSRLRSLFPRPRPWALRLSNDCWRVIDGFAQSEALRRSCSRLHRVIPWRAVSCYVDPLAGSVYPLFIFLKRKPTVRTLTVTGTHFDAQTASQLSLINTIPSLTSVTLNLPRNQLRDFGCRALSDLATLPALTSLTVDLRWNDITSGVAYLGALSNAPALQTLRLYLGGNCSGHPRVSQGLATLRDAPALTDLTIDLEQEHIANHQRLRSPLGVSARHLAPLLSDSRALTAQTLNLAGNNIQNAGAGGLAGLQIAPTLRTLTLDLRRNRISEAGVHALVVALKAAPALQALHLELGDNDVQDAGTGALADLRRSRSLTDVQLGLSHNGIGDGGAVALAGLGTAAALQALRLDLRGNAIGGVGRAALGCILASVCTTLHFYDPSPPAEPRRDCAASSTSSASPPDTACRGPGHLASVAVPVHGRFFLHCIAAVALLAVYHVLQPQK